MESMEVDKNRGILDQATAFKDSGNQHYAAKDYRAAMRCYHKCLLQARVLVQIPTQLHPNRLRRTSLKRKSESEGMEEVAEGGGEEEVGDGDAKVPDGLDHICAEAHKLITNCYNNLAACILNGPERDAETYLRAAEYCEKVLAKEEGNEKAQFRKGLAYQMAKEYEKALACFDKTPQNAEAVRRRGECVRALEAERRARDEEIRRNFEKSQRRDAPPPAQPPPPPDLPNGHLPSTSTQ